MQHIDCYVLSLKIIHKILAREEIVRDQKIIDLIIQCLHAMS